MENNTVLQLNNIMVDYISQYYFLTAIFSTDFIFHMGLLIWAYIIIIIDIWTRFHKNQSKLLYILY